jgi:hypothetical protein
LSFSLPRFLAAVLLTGAPVLWAQNSAPDPIAATRGLPVYVRVLPKPEVEPWSAITPKQRFLQYEQLTFSPMATLTAASAGAISQAIDSPKEWGQGWGDYGVRTASSYGSTLVGNTVIYGASALFHEDTRYFRSTSDKFSGRLAHVLASPYLARTDEGRTRLSASMFLGSAAYSGAQLAWSPESSQGWRNVGINYLLWSGQKAGLNLVKEFYPGVARHYRNKQASRTSKQLAAIMSQSAGQP